MGRTHNKRKYKRERKKTHKKRNSRRAENEADTRSIKSGDYYLFFCSFPFCLPCSHSHSSLFCGLFFILCCCSSLCTFCFSSHFILQASPSLHPPIRRIFDCVRRKIFLILIRPPDQHVDACVLLFHVDTCLPYRFANSRILLFH